MNVRQRIADKLSATFSPSALEVIDESERHRGHAGYREGGQSHFRVRIVAPAFAGMSRLARHRAVNAALADEIAGGIHALAVSALAPEEAKNSPQA